MLAWADILMEGPLTGDVVTGGDREFRARYLNERFSIPREQYREGMGRCLARLGTFAAHDEVVLWFEEDLFCQVHLLFLLNWFSERPLGHTRLTLICPPDHLGTLQPAALASLFATRAPVTAVRTALARVVWAAYTSRDPLALNAALDADFSAWPLLRRGIRAHLERFPSRANGLNNVETESLRALADHSLSFPELFAAVSAAEPAMHLGMGDTQFAAYLDELSRGRDPLVRIVGGESAGEHGERLARAGAWRITATPLADEVLNGARDRVAPRGLDRWLGGVSLAPGSVPWRWDAGAGRIMRAAG